MNPALLTSLLPVFDRVLDMIPNSEKAAAAKQQIMADLIKIGAEERIAQVGLNKVEAQHKSLFVAGWRPFIGWVGGVSLLWTFLLRPLLDWVATLMGYTGTFPELATGELISLVFAMLGVGAMRSFDKMNGVSTESLTPPPKNITTTFNE